MTDPTETNAIQLYELVGTDRISACPFVWRVKFALAQKGLRYDSHEVGFSEIPSILGGAYKSVPVMVDGSIELGDSWLIADHLDAAYPDRPPLFHCPAERALARFIDNWLNTQILPKFLSAFVFDIHERARPEDRAYFRQTREARFGRTLEEVHAERHTVMPVLRAAFEPLRQTLAGQSFLSGEHPGYGDFMAVGVILWGAGLGSTPLFQADDPLLAWVERCLDLYGGIGRQTAFPALSEAMTTD